MARRRGVNEASRRFRRGPAAGARRRCLPALTVLLAIGGSFAHAIELTDEQRSAVLDEAMRAFDRGAAIRDSGSGEAIAAFREAAAKFELLVAAGIHNGRLYYNLGNAYLESGQLGRAIVCYRRALRLAPGDGTIEHNLAYARSLRRNQIEAAGRQAFLQTLFFWHYGTAMRTRYRVALAAYLAFWLMLTARCFTRRFRWRFVLVPALALWLAAGASVAAEAYRQAHRVEGVLIANDVVVRKGNGERFEPQFKQKLHEGVEFEVIEQRRDWLQVRLPDGKTGWVKTDQVELI